MDVSDFETSFFFCTAKVSFCYPGLHIIARRFRAKREILPHSPKKTCHPEQSEGPLAKLRSETHFQPFNKLALRGTKEIKGVEKREKGRDNGSFLLHLKPVSFKIYWLCLAASINRQ